MSTIMINLTLEKYRGKKMLHFSFIISIMIFILGMANPAFPLSKAYTISNAKADADNGADLVFVKFDGQYTTKSIWVNTEELEAKCYSFTHYSSYTEEDPIQDKVCSLSQVSEFASKEPTNFPGGLNVDVYQVISFDKKTGVFRAPPNGIHYYECPDGPEAPCHSAEGDASTMGDEIFLPLCWVFCPIENGCVCPIPPGDGDGDGDGDGPITIPPNGDPNTIPPSDPIPDIITDPTADI